MAKDNTNLHKARKAKNDSFFTRYEDIEKEVSHYKEELKGKWVYCPCDTEESNFWKYFVNNYEKLGITHLTATHINLDGSQSERLDYDGKNITRTIMEGNGDFRSEDCTKIKDKCDLVCTNPPFSLFRDFIYWLNGGTFHYDNKKQDFVKDE